MPATEGIQESQIAPDRSTLGMVLCFAALLVAVFLFQGKTIPFSNEFVYLLRLQPNFLPNDWSFAFPANEHWLFNLIFSLPSRIFSLEAAGWICRIASWIVLLVAVLKLGRLWEIAYWKIAFAVFLWLAFAQAVVNDEWMFGGFEAKVVAYICLVFSLVAFSKRKIVLPSILLGLTFSFHPAVGLWAILAVGLAFLFERIPVRDLAKVVIITGLFALFGLLPLLGDQMSSAAGSYDDWKFVILIRTPALSDVFQFSKSGTLLCFVMLGFNCFALWKSENFALRFLLKFQLALGAFFLLGAAFRWFEMFSLLRLMPLRLFPLFTPLFFIFTAFYLIPRFVSKQHRILAMLFAVLVVAFLNPIGKGYMQISETVRTWTTGPDDLQLSSRWISEHTPPDSIIIQPPNRSDLWYFSKRAEVVSFGYPTYERLGEWRTRLGDLTGGRMISKGDTASEEIENDFNQLSFQQIEQVRAKYSATYLVSCATYPYPIVFKTETYKVYQLP